MKTLKLGMSAILLSLCLVSFSQSSSSSSSSTKKNVYYVQSAHTPEQCLSALTEIKSKGDALLSKFEFGCMSGNHTGYAFLEATSEENVKQMLPKDALASAKIQKVDKFTSAQIEEFHKEHAKK
jgi:hypothetical protein